MWEILAFSTCVLVLGTLAMRAFVWWRDHEDEREHRQDMERLNKAEAIAHIVVADQALAENVRARIDLAYPKVRVEIDEPHEEEEERDRDSRGRFKRKRKK